MIFFNLQQLNYSDIQFLDVDFAAMDTILGLGVEFGL